MLQSDARVIHRCSRAICSSAATRPLERLILLLSSPALILAPLAIVGPYLSLACSQWIRQCRPQHRLHVHAQHHLCLPECPLQLLRLATPSFPGLNKLRLVPAWAVSALREALEGTSMAFSRHVNGLGCLAGGGNGRALLCCHLLCNTALALLTSWLQGLKERRVHHVLLLGLCPWLEFRSVEDNGQNYHDFCHFYGEASWATR